MAIWGALIGAAASAYAAKSASNTQANAQAESNQMNWDMWHGANAFNREEAATARDFNAAEAEKARAFSASSAQEAMDFSAGQAQQNRDWQKMMSDTSYQRAVGDMKSAGLNPMLAYSQGGASSPGGSSASGVAASAPSASGPGASSSSPPRMEPVQQFSKAQLIANTASSFLDIDRKLAENEAIRASTGRTKQETTNAEWDAKLKENEWKYQVPMLHERLDQMMTDSAQKDFAWKMREKLKDVEEQVRRGELTEQKARIAAIQIGNQLRNYEIPGARNEAAYESSAVGRASRYVKEVTGMVGGVADIIKPTVGSRGRGQKSYSETYYDRSGNPSGGKSRDYQE